MAGKPSILFAIPWDLSTIGGVTQVVLNLARETLRQDRLQPIVLCNNPDDEPLRVSDFDGITVLTAHLRAPLAERDTARNIFSFALTMRKDISTWRDILRSYNIRVVNAHYAYPGYMLFAVMRALNGALFRLVFSLHGSDVSALNSARSMTRASGRWMLKQADDIVTSSKDLAARAASELKLDETTLTTIYHGIDRNELDLAKAHEYRPPTGTFDDYLLNVGNFEHNRGQDVLIDAYLQLVRGGLKSALVMIGGKGTALPTLRSRVRKLGLQQHVFFVADLDHLSTLAAIRNARLLVLPSRDEPFGLPLIEAAYLRTPIVASNVGGIPEVLGGYYPYLVKPEDSKMLAQNIDDALFNPTETDHQVSLLRRRTATRFTWAQAYERYEPIWLGAN